MPCYEPPRPDRHDYDEMMRQRDKYVATLKEIEDVCKHLQPNIATSEAKFIAQTVLDIIDSHWREQ